MKKNARSAKILKNWTLSLLWNKVEYIEYATNYVDKKMLYPPFWQVKKIFSPPPQVGEKKVLPPPTMHNRSQMFILQPP